MGDAVALTIHTYGAQREGMTAASAVREHIDNGIGMSAELPAGSPPIALMSNIDTLENAVTKEKTRVLWTATQTVFQEGQWGGATNVIGPKKTGTQSHVGSIHGSGIQNSMSGTSDSDKAHLMAFNCVAIPGATKEPFHKYRGQRIGEHADNVCKEENQTGMELRGSLSGRLDVHPDPRASAAPNHLTLSWVSDKKGGKAEHPTTEEYRKSGLLMKNTSETGSHFLGASPFEPDPNGHQNDHGDALLFFLENVKTKIAKSHRGKNESLPQALARVNQTSMVIIVQWPLRAEIQLVNGKMEVEGKSQHEMFANTYLPPQSESRRVLTDLGVVHGQPSRTITCFQGQRVDYTEHAVMEQVAQGTLLPFTGFVNGLGPNGTVLKTDHFLLEAYTTPLKYLGTKKELTLQLHMPSTLAVGDSMGWGRGQLMQDPKEVGKRLICVDDVSTFLSQKSTARCRILGKKDACGKYYESCFSAGCELPEALLKEVDTCFQFVWEIKKMCGDADSRRKSAEEAALKMEGFKEDYPDATPGELVAAELRLDLEEGGSNLVHANVNKILRFIIGEGLTYHVTMLEDLPLTKAKTHVTSQTEALLSLHNTVMHTNAHIFVAKVKEMCRDMKIDTSALVRTQEEIDTEEQRRKQRDAEDKKRGEQQRLRSEERTALQRERQAAKQRMLGLGAFPTKSGGRVQFVKGDQQEPWVVTKPAAEVEAALQEGRLRMKNTLFTFKGNAAEGKLLNAEGVAVTEIVKATSQASVQNEVVLGDSQRGRQRENRSDKAQEALFDKTINVQVTTGTTMPLGIKTANATSQLCYEQGRAETCTDPAIVLYTNALAKVSPKLLTSYGAVGALRINRTATEEFPQTLVTVRFHTVLFKTTGERKPDYRPVCSVEGTQLVVDVFLCPIRKELQPPNDMTTVPKKTAWLVNRITELVLNGFVNEAPLTKEQRAPTAFYLRGVLMQQDNRNFAALNPQQPGPAPAQRQQQPPLPPRKRPCAHPHAGPASQRPRTSAGAGSSSSSASAAAAAAVAANHLRRAA